MTRAQPSTTYHNSRYTDRMQALLDYILPLAGTWRRESGPDDPDVQAIARAIDALLRGGKAKRTRKETER